MLEGINNSNIMFIDIETVSQYRNYSEVPDNLKYLWDKKAKSLRYDDSVTPEELYDKSSIYAEFGKIVCISVGFYDFKENTRNFRVTSLYGDNEKKILEEFKEILCSFQKSKGNIYLCAHNGKEFDFPYIARRMLVNNIKLPDILDVAGKKPWETTFIDTMELWRFGDYKNYTSLELLTTIFNIKNPKENVDGSEVYSLYWESHDFDAISEYCKNDVVAIAQLFLKYKGEEIINDENIIYIKKEPLN